MPDSPHVADLLTTPSAGRDLTWLKQALQTALKLEFATLPPYLCAWWSIKSASGRASDHLREVIMEEMLHLGLACNMLTAIGGTPRLYPDASPAFPGPLPGGVRPGLVVPLQGLTREAVKTVFMEIEKPHHDISGVDPTDETDPTIGDFYDAIQGAFESLPDQPLTGTPQQERQIPVVENAIALLFKIQSKDDARRAIHVIKEQGEGTATSPFDDSKHIAGDLAHYFRFAELYHGKQLVLGQEGTITYTGADVPFPDAYPMSVVPSGGYKSADVEQTVQQKLLKFDQNYTKMLKKLQLAWEAGSPEEADEAFDESVSAMFSLRGPARQLMQIPIPGGTGTYGPCFRISE